MGALPSSSEGRRTVRTRREAAKSSGWVRAVIVGPDDKVAHQREFEDCYYAAPWVHPSKWPQARCELAITELREWLATSGSGAGNYTILITELEPVTGKVGREWAVVRLAHPIRPVQYGTRHAC